MSRKLVSFRLADDLRQALKERASNEGISTTELVNRLLRQALLHGGGKMSTEIRLSVLEEGFQQVARRMDFESSLSGVLTQPHQGVSEKFTKMEKRLEQLSAGVEESCQNLNRLVKAMACDYELDVLSDKARGVQQLHDESQAIRQGHRSHDMNKRSLEDPQNLLTSDD